MKIFVFFVTSCCVFLSTYAMAASCGTNMNDNGDGTVTDMTTGLTWRQCLEGLTGGSCDDLGTTADTKTWSDAVDMGDGTWRVPNVKELQSIVDESAKDPAINTTCFPNTPTGYVWSSSPYAADGTRSWIVSFSNGQAGAVARTGAYNVRLVRDAPTL
ncbi:MAG: DUF1566 domain-containing protein [Candidatus Electrothrix communis]|nr:MAG: DUF1566 domain-containing protein [Candidatus Electrothrix communis]